MTSTSTARSLRSLHSSLSCSLCRAPRFASAPILQSRRNYATPISSSTSTSPLSTSPSSSSLSSSSSSSKSNSSGGIPNPSAYAVFDRSTKIKQKNRAVRRDIDHSRLTDYVKDEIAANMVERLLVSSVTLETSSQTVAFVFSPRSL